MCRVPCLTTSLIPSVAISAFMLPSVCAVYRPKFNSAQMWPGASLHDGVDTEHLAQEMPFLLSADDVTLAWGR